MGWIASCDVIFLEDGEMRLHVIHERTNLLLNSTYGVEKGKKVHIVRSILGPWVLVGLFLDDD